MAKNQQGPIFKQQATFNKSLVTDSEGTFLPESSWTYARNAINNSVKGDLGTLSNEQSNTLCTFAPYVIIGSIFLENDKWVLFSTNNTQSEIGLFYENTCTYEKLVRDTCLSFNSDNLIKGIMKPNFKCSFDIYWDDGINPTRVLDIKKIPYKQDCVTTNDCTVCTDIIPLQLDCDKIRLEPLIQTPCVKLSLGTGVGTLYNGTYQASICYVKGNQKVTDWFSPSNALTIFSHQDTDGSINLTISNADLNFDYFKVALITTIKSSTVVYEMGIYNIRQNFITFDDIDISLPKVSDLTIVTPVPDKSDAMFITGDYAIRVGPTYKYKFNYQPLANQIETFWQSVEYKNNYYQNGGTNIGYMRDEVYSFFIRFIYNTGDKSDSFHIPGRVNGLFAITNDAGSAAGYIDELAPCPATLNDIESPAYVPAVYEVYNTAYQTSAVVTTLPDGGNVVAEGKMGYWQSSEKYDDLHPVIWNANVPGRPDWDLCGKPIRHHKFPDNVIVTGGSSSSLANHYKDGGNEIRIMGVRFDNILPPVDNNGVIISNISGYEILRGNRTGNKSVLYKGIINNMFKYNAPSLISNKQVLYPNYPFNDLRPDPFISSNVNETSFEPLFSPPLRNYTPNADYSQKHFTFHSPDTMFARPVLTDDELKIYGAVHGDTSGSYNEVVGHPKHKLIKDAGFIVGLLAGLAYAMKKINGIRGTKYKSGSQENQPVFLGIGATSVGNASGAGTLFLNAASNALNNTTRQLANTVDAVTGLNEGILSAKTISNVVSQAVAAGNAVTPLSGASAGQVEHIYEDDNQIHTLLKMFLLGSPAAAGANPIFISYMAEGCHSMVELIKAVGSWQQFAIQYTSKCDYDKFYQPQANNRRRKIKDSRYLNPGIFDYDSSFMVNNALRSETVILNTKINIENVNPIIQDTSRPPRLSNVSGNRYNNITRKASSHYVAYKTRLINQYGQLDSIMQLMASTCQLFLDETNQPTSSGVIFGGDTYIGKYSEKNTLYYFRDWLSNQPDGTIHNYKLHKMFDHTAFWVDFDPWDLMEFVQSIPAAFKAAIEQESFGAFFSSIVTPSDKYCVDKAADASGHGFFLLKNAYFYLFNSGIRNFFIESEYNIDLRDYGNELEKKHYPIASNLKEMFSLKYIRGDNYYLYDRSFSHSFTAVQRVPWGVLQQRDYDPLLEINCFTHTPRRLLFSLPNMSLQEDISLSKTDNWTIFLPRNFADYTSNITSIKNIAASGAIILFESQSPGLLPGVSQLKVSNESITVGDGALFSRKLQRLSNTEEQYEFGSCQSRLSVVNTPAGIYWMCTNQGKIFSYSEGLSEISGIDDKYWLNRYLPLQLILDFPTYELLDNPVSGIGCQTIYDNEYQILYFCKKDFRIKPNLANSGITVEYAGGSRFLINGVFYAETGDPRYFDNCSWTMSYDPKIKKFISFHDWHPNLFLGAKNTFLTTQKNSLWKHNNACNSYCNFYGKDYPFEVEFQLDNAFQVATTSNIEYFIESFVYDDNCYDRFHVLDYGFDQASIYNTEQSSGLLKLNIAPKNNLPLELSYPIIKLDSIEILVYKEEQKYRFNQFWDITKNRGEYTTTQQVALKTENNGYIRYFNPFALNYNKKEFQRKKFRHYDNKVRLIRTKNTNVEIIVSLANSNQKISYR